MTAERILLSEQAKADLRAIENYIAEQDGEARAGAFRVRIGETIKRLALMPAMGGSRPYLEPGQRAFPDPPWTIFYEELEELDGINIVRIIDGRRNLPSIFGEKRGR